MSRLAPGCSVTWTSSVAVSRHTLSATTTEPRPTAPLSSPGKASAVRLPGSAVRLCSPCTSMLLTRDVSPPGSTRTTSPTATEPLHVDPVTTVPAPETLKTRSTGSRNRSREERTTAFLAASTSASVNRSNPCSVTAEHTTGGCQAMEERATRSSTSERTSSSHSGSTRSLLVIATAPDLTPRNSTIAKCSSVCGITPSSAATTRRAISTPVAPATMLRTKSS